MPSVSSWVLTGPVTVSPFSPPTSLPPIVGSVVACNASWYTQEALLGVLDRSYPADYTVALKTQPNGGYELFYAASKLFERISVAIARRLCCSYVFSALGGVKATGAVEFYREDATYGAITIMVGSVVRTENGKEFVTTEEAVFGAVDLGPHTVAVEARFVGFEYNVAGEVVTPRGETIPGDICEIKKLTTPVLTPNIDPYTRVRNVAATTGGIDASLDALAYDRGMYRNKLETDDQFRLRIVQTPDTVSPAAIQRAADSVLEPFGSVGCLREVGTSKLPGFFYDAGSSADSPQVEAHNFAYDFGVATGTPRVGDRFKLHLDTKDFRGFFLLGVPKLVEANFPGMVYDGTTSDPFPMTNAYDTAAVDSPFAAYDGVTLLNGSVYKAISDTISGIKAGGVGFTLYLEEIGCF
jgi:hypothetical protein